MNTLALVLTVVVIASYAAQPLLKYHYGRKTVYVEYQVIFAHLILWVPLQYFFHLARLHTDEQVVFHGWQVMSVVIMGYCLWMIFHKWQTIAAKRYETRMDDI